MSDIRLRHRLLYTLLVLLGRSNICRGLRVAMVLGLRAISIIVFLHLRSVLRTLLWDVGLRPPAGLLRSSIPVLEIIRYVRVSWAPLLLSSALVGRKIALLSNRNSLSIDWVLALARLGVRPVRPLKMSSRSLRALRLRVQQLAIRLRFWMMRLALDLSLLVSTCSNAAPFVLPSLSIMICVLWLTVRLILTKTLRDLQDPDKFLVVSGICLYGSGRGKCKVVACLRCCRGLRLVIRVLV